MHYEFYRVAMFFTFIWTSTLILQLVKYKYDGLESNSETFMQTIYPFIMIIFAAAWLLNPLDLNERMARI